MILGRTAGLNLKSAGPRLQVTVNSWTLLPNKGARKNKFSFTMSALPYGSAAPMAAPVYGGSAVPFQNYGSAYPTTGYPSSYDQSFQPYQSYSAPVFSAPVYPSYSLPDHTPIPVPNPTPAPKEDVVEKRKKTSLEQQLEKVKELEKELEAAVHDLEFQHVKLNQKHSAEYNALFQQQTQVMTAQSQKVINAYNDVPSKYTATAIPPLAPPDSQYPPIGSSIPVNQQTSATAQTSAGGQHPMSKLQNVQNKIIALRKHLDAELEKERARK